MLQQLLRDVVALQDRSSVATFGNGEKSIVLILAGPGRQRYAALILAVEVKIVDNNRAAGNW